MNNTRTEQKQEKNLIAYYSEKYNEDTRHDDVFGQLQKERSYELLDRFLQKPRSTIADIGGATGVYAFYLAKEGHGVYLIDPVPKHIDVARTRNESTVAKLKECVLADARALDFADGLFDAVICHGPMYHLLDKADRMCALNEAYRVLQPGGTLLVFAINRYAGLFYGITEGLILDEQYCAMICTEIASGKRIRDPGWFFHFPDELRHELMDANFEVIDLLGVVGPTWMLPDAEQKWKDPVTKRKMLALSRMLEREVIIGPDLLCIGKKAR